jgi:hypothetical protein
MTSAKKFAAFTAGAALPLIVLMAAAFFMEGFLR